MTPALFIDVPNVIKTRSKQSFPIHRSDWFLTEETLSTIKKYTDSNYRVFLIGNYSDIPVKKHDPNPIENLFVAIATHIEKELKLPPNNIGFDYATDRECFDYLPLPGLFYSLAVDHELLLGYSFVITTINLGKFIQQYSSVKPINL